MSSQFRATTPLDAGAISTFMQHVFGMSPEHPGLNPCQMDWKYWRPHPEWIGARGYVMERDGQIVAHGSVVPLTCLWDGQRFKLIDLIDWAAHPAHPGAGITLLKRVAKLVDGVFIAGGTDSAQRVFDSLGFRRFADANKYAVPVRPLARLMRDNEAIWKRGARLVRNVAWTVDTLNAVPPGWSARAVDRAEVTRTVFPRPAPEPDMAVFERTPESIAFLLECPITPSRFYIADLGGVTRGYFILNIAQNQCRIGDAWMDSGRAADWRALYSLALNEARLQQGVTEVVTVANTGVAREALAANGFRPRGITSLRMLLPDRCPPAIRYQLTDNDSAYMNDGKDVYWT